MEALQPDSGGFGSEIRRVFDESVLRSVWSSRWRVLPAKGTMWSSKPKSPVIDSFLPLAHVVVDRDCRYCQVG